MTSPKALLVMWRVFAGVSALRILTVSSVRMVAMC